MSYKFNRNCWVESTVDALYGRGDTDEYPDHPESFSEGRGPHSITQRITLARDLFAERESALRDSERVASLLARLEEDLAATSRAMFDLGVGEACARCDAEEPEGSCCSRGLEDKFDAVLLLVNLLLGVSLPERRSREDSCLFLGPRGCLLRLRHMLCVDYLCPKLEETLGFERLTHLRTVSGKEIESSFHLCEEIKRILLA